MSYSVINPQNPLILASASPRRRELLNRIQLPFRSVPSRVNEDLGMAEPERLCRFLAEAKAKEVQVRTGGLWTLGADTLVVIGRDIMGKPGDAAEARHMLTRLAGKEHRVITGLCVRHPGGGTAFCEAVSTRVWFKALTDREIEAYLATGEPFGKAGSYAIQGIGSFMVEAISGSYSNVVGLPVCSLIKGLCATGALAGFPMAP